MAFIIDGAPRFTRSSPDLTRQALGGEPINARTCGTRETLARRLSGGNNATGPHPPTKPSRRDSARFVGYMAA